MRNIISFICALVLAATFFACNSNTNKNATATVDFTEAINTKDVYLFSTLDGSGVIIVNYVKAIEMNKLTMKQKGISMHDVGFGNAFVVNKNNKRFLYTARHATKGVREDIIKDLGADISIMDLDSIIKCGANIERVGCNFGPGYSIDTNIKNGDSVFIQGYYTDKDGILKTVYISGTGVIKYDDDKAFQTTKFKEYMQRRQYLLTLPKFCDLAGLSGSPVFNKKNQVIGVFSGRLENPDTHECFARVSLFN
jgi:hypothetical protein